VVAKLMAVCMALILFGGVVQAARFHVASTAAVELSVDPGDPGDRPADVVVPVEPIVAPPLGHGIAIEMPPITQLITYRFAPRMDRPPRN
jgi:hypothetical protein